MQEPILGQEKARERKVVKEIMGGKGVNGVKGRLNSKGMVILKTTVVTEFLHHIQRNQVWLAGKIGVKKEYMNMLINNRCKIPDWVKERLMLITNIEFDHLFSYDGKHDGREFYNGEVWLNDELLKTAAYREKINA